MPKKRNSRHLSDSNEKRWAKNRHKNDSDDELSTRKLTKNCKISKFTLNKRINTDLVKENAKLEDVEESFEAYLCYL